MFRRIPNHHIWPLLITLGLTIYQIIRIIIFVNVYGGVEHDGGWMLSISRSLAEQGTYTTLVSTIVEPGLPGGINVDQKFDIQAADGRIWFFTGNGIGPASIVPDALVLTLFGAGFWALRAGPLIFYALFLILAAVIVYRLAGLGAVVLFHAFIFFYPHLSIFLSYEAMGEVPSMVYVLWAYLAGGAALQATGRRWRSFLGVGLVAGLALIAKIITLWSLSGIFIWTGLLWLAGLVGARSGRVERDDEASGRLSPKVSELLALAGGAVLPTVLWELVHLVVLTRLTGFAMYVRQAQQRIGFIVDDGSGLGSPQHAGPEFVWDKFFLLTEVTHPQRWVTAIMLIVILVGGVGFIWHWRGQVQKQDLLAPMWLGWLANMVWFVGIAKTGWPRHLWFGLVLAVLLLCVITVASIRLGLERVRTSGAAVSAAGLPLAAGIVLLGLIGWGFAVQPYVLGLTLPDEIVPYWQARQINNKYGASLPWMIIPRAAQGEIVAYLDRLPPEANIYYPAHHKAAEISAQVGRVLYPLDRRPFMEPHADDVALISPTLIGPWQEAGRRAALLEQVWAACPQPIMANDYYMICPFPPQ
jgi:hypothetical protein